MSFLGNFSDGDQLGYYWTGAAWAKFGLTDTGNLKITGGSASGSTWVDGAGDLQLKNGLGIDIQSTGTLNVNSGATTLGGNLVVTGTSEFNNTVDVDGNFAVRTSGGVDKFTIASSTGNAVASGNLTVNGNIDLGSSTSNTLTITAQIDADVDPASNNTYDFGQTNLKWKDGYFGGTVNATTFAGNVSSSTGTSTFNNVTVNGTLSATLTGNISGNSATATALQTARSIGGVSFNGTADINLPGVNQAGNQDTSGNAASATQSYVTHSGTDSLNRGLVFCDAANSASGNKDLKYDGDLVYNANSNTLYAPTIQGTTATYTTFGNAGQNAYGARYVSTNNPSGGSDGDIWYKY